MTKHPTDRAERLRVNEKKTKPKPKISKFKRKLREAVAAQEAEHELQAVIKDGRGVDLLVEYPVSDRAAVVRNGEVEAQ